MERRGLVSNTDIRYAGVLRSTDRGTVDIYLGIDSRAARKACPTSLWSTARRKLDLIATAPALEELRVPPGNRLETLRGDRRGQYSIRVNERYRVCFRWDDSGAADVEIVDYH
jgi:toxin HigB-1